MSNWIINGGGHAQNIRQPKSFYLTDFTDHTLRAFGQVTTECLNSQQPILPIYIESYGGNVDIMAGILSLMDYCRDRGLKFSTIVNGKAMSAGAMVWLYGEANLRFIGTCGKLMMHHASTIAGGKLPELKTTIDLHSEDQHKLFEKISRHIKKPKDWLKKNLEKRKDGDWYLNPDEVVAEKLGSKHTPTFVLNISENFLCV